jgi:hypothetical protein
MRRLRQLEEENRGLKAIVADPALELRALKDVLVRNGYGPRWSRAMVTEVMTTHALSRRRARELIGITRRGFQRAPAPDHNLH